MLPTQSAVRFSPEADRSCPGLMGRSIYFAVAVPVGTLVGVLVGVLLEVLVGVRVGVLLGVRVAVGVRV
jgi:hypothetical protein